jgi:hypothetical protein
MNYHTTSEGDVPFTEEEELEHAAMLAAQTAAALPNAKAAFIREIDITTDSINTAVIGGRAQEYELAEKHAQSYKDAGYTGTVPSSVSSWATAKSWTATQAADDILQTATGWRQAQSAIRANRLLCKENARNAASIEALNMVKAQWAGFLAAIKPSLGL